MCLVPRSQQNLRPRPSWPHRTASRLRPKSTRILLWSFFCVLSPMDWALFFRAVILASNSHQSQRVFLFLYLHLHLYLVFCLITIIADNQMFVIFICRLCDFGVLIQDRVKWIACPTPKFPGLPETHWIGMPVRIVQDQTEEAFLPVIDGKGCHCPHHACVYEKSLDWKCMCNLFGHTWAQQVKLCWCQCVFAKFLLAFACSITRLKTLASLLTFSSVPSCLIVLPVVNVLQH